MSEVFNIFDGELDLERDRPGFSWRRAMVGAKIGADKLGASLYELEPGERTFPYHYEYGVEEWLGRRNALEMQSTPHADGVECCGVAE